MYNYTRYAYSCYLSESPYSCELSDGVDCERGDGAREYIYGCLSLVLFCSIIITIVVSMLVYEIFYQEKKIDRFLTQGQEQRRVMTIKTAWQGLYYIGAYNASYFPYILWAICFIKGIPPPAAIQYLIFIFIPLLGCFNAFVYFRPRYLIYQGANPDKSRIFCLRKTLRIDLNWLSPVTFGRLSFTTSAQCMDSERVDPSERRLSTTISVQCKDSERVDPTRANCGDPPSPIVDGDCTDREVLPSPLF
jgi:hypothetical protein